ncbi:MAG: maleylpyruvate isomerase family mycothiol-dependent enzyme [Actinomycetota bacterium]
MSTQLAMARAERVDLADYLASLSPQQWQLPTLCTEWTVKDVVAHVISYEELNPLGLLRRFARGRGANANQVGVDEYRALTPDELIGFLRAHTQPRGLTAAFGGMIALVDGTIHHQDIRRALGHPRVIPPDRLARVLQLTRGNPRLGVPKRIRGLRLRAVDLDWETGAGTDVSGPGEALMMAMAGRPDSLGELAGPGREVLAVRMGVDRSSWE